MGTETKTNINRLNVSLPEMFVAYHLFVELFSFEAIKPFLLLPNFLAWAKSVNVLVGPYSNWKCFPFDRNRGEIVCI